MREVGYSGGGGGDEKYERESLEDRYISADSDFVGLKLDVADSQGVKEGCAFSGTHAKKYGNSAFEHKKGYFGLSFKKKVRP